MHGNASDRRATEREALRNFIAQWNANRLDLFELSEPNEDLEFHGVMRFYFQDSGQKVATKCIRVASDATVSDVIETLIEKFRPDMRMLSVPSYALYEIHENCPERRLAPDEKPLLVQLNWHDDDREGRFLLKNIDDKPNMSSMGLSDSNSSFRRKLSKREKKQLKKQEKLSRLKGENDDSNEKKDNVAEKLYTELPETSFTRSISNPEAVMRRRRQQKLERKLQQFRSKDGGPDTGGTLKIYGEALCRDVPYKTLLLSVRDCASTVVREMLDKYGLSRQDPAHWCLVQVTTPPPGAPPGTATDQEYVLDDDECPLAILMNHSSARGSIMFHVRRRPADCAPRKRKKKPALGSGGGGGGAGTRDSRGDSAPVLVELGPDGQPPHPGDVGRTLRLNSDVMEVGSANGIALQLYGPHIQPRHCVIANTDGLTSLTPCHADAHTYVNGHRIYQTTILQHGNLVKFGHSNTYQFLDPSQESRSRHPSTIDSTSVYDRSPRALSPTEAPPRENYETTFDLEGNVETVSTASVKEDNRSLGSVSENRMLTIDRYPRGQDPILPAVLEFPEEPQEQFLARVITHLDVTTPSFKLVPAYTLYLCARYRASTHYRPELTPTERAHKLTVLLQHAAMLIRHTVQERRADSTSQGFWLANASELLHFLKSDRHVSAFSLQAQDTLADAVQSAFRNLVTCLTDELNAALGSLVSDTTDDHPNQVISVLSSAMSLLRKCRVNAALTIQLFSQLFHWISARSLSTIINNPALCTKSFGQRLFNRLRNLQAWAESQGLELAAECHLAKILQCAHLLQAPKYTADELANLSATCFKLNSLQLRALLTQYKGEMGEQVPSAALIEQTARAAESVADELTRADGREVRLHEDTTLPVQLLLPEDGFSCEVVQGVPQGLAEFLQPLQGAGLCRLAGQPTSSGHWTVYMSAPRSPSALSATQPEVQVIRLHKAGGGMGLSIVAAKGAGQERLGIYIKSVVPGGAADLDGRLAAGDQLLSVDGQSLLGITQERAAEFLVRTGNTVTLEVAKGGAVYHGLATLLQQPSPTPHRAEDYYTTVNRFRGSQDSLYGSTKGNIFSPRQKSSGFFSSDDSLYKTELRKLTIPRISIETTEPIFNLEITDFSEPYPKDTYIIDETFTEYPKLNLLDVKNIKKNKSGPVSQMGSNIITHNLSVEINDIPYIDSDKNVVDDIEKYDEEKKDYYMPSQDCSSSQSSMNSLNTGNQELTLDLTLANADVPEKPKCWKSPDQVRLGYVKTVAKQFDDMLSNRTVTIAHSVPELRNITKSHKKKTCSEENLANKLTETERLEIFKLLQDWSTFGSDAPKPNITISKTIIQNINIKQQRITEPSEEKININVINKPIDPLKVKYKSETNISSEIKNEETHFHSDKPKSESELSKLISENFSEHTHKCKFKNCIFNEDAIRNLKNNNPPCNKIEQHDSNSERNKLYLNDNLTLNNDHNLAEDYLENVNKTVILNSENSDNNTNAVSRKIEHEENLDTKYLINNISKDNLQSSNIEKELNTAIDDVEQDQYKLKMNSGIKGILKNAFDKISPLKRAKNNKSKLISLQKPFNGNLVRSDSFDNIHRCRKKYTARVYSATDIRKFPESYIVTRKSTKKFNSDENLFICNCLECKNQDALRRQKIAAIDKNKPARNIETKSAAKTSPKIVYVHRKVKAKTWKSCSDIVNKRKAIKKCCRYAKRTCPIMKSNSYLKRDIKSCADVSEDAFEKKCLEKYSTTFPDNIGPRRMSERDLPSRVDSERSIPSSKSVPALHHISQGGGENGRTSHDVFNPGYSRTSSNNSINNGVQNGNIQPPTQQGLRSRSTHNLNQQDAGFYQNLSVYRNKMPSPQQLGDRTSALRSSQNSLHSTNTQRPSSAYYPPSVANAARPANLHQSIPNLKSPPSVHRLHGDDSRSGSFPTVNSGARIDDRTHYPHQNYPMQTVPRSQNEEMKYAHFPNAGHPLSPQYGAPNQRQEEIRQATGNSYANQHHNMIQGYPAGPQHPLSPMSSTQRSHDELIRHPSNDIRYQQGLLREDVFRQSQQGRMEDQRLTANGNIRNEDMRAINHIRNEEMLRYPSTNNIKSPETQSRTNEEVLRQQTKVPHEDMMRNEMRPSKSEDMLRQPTREELMRYNSTNNIRAQDDQKMDDRQQFMQTHSAKHIDDIRHGRSEEILKQNQNEIVRQHPINASLRGQAKMVEMSEEVRRRQNRLGYNQYPPNTSNYQQYQQQNPNSPYYQQSQMNQGYQQQYYNQNQQPVSQYSQQYQQPMSPSYTQQNTSGQNLRSYPNTPNQQTSMAQAQTAMQNLSLNTSYQQNVTSPGYNQNNYSYNSQMSPQSAYPKSPPTAPKPKPKAEETPPELPPSSTHPLYAASLQEPPKGAFYPSPTVQGKGGPANPWEREEREKEMEARRVQARQWRDQQIRDLSALPQRTPQQEEQLRALRLEREFERRAQEAEQEDEDGEKESPPPQPPYLPQSTTNVPSSTTAATPPSKPEPPTSILKPGAAPTVNQTAVSQPPVQENEAPPPPERGSSYAIMSMRVKEGTKRVSFDTSGHSQSQEIVHEDPNQFIAQAESMLASPTTPTEPTPGQSTATPGVIGAQEVYRDPRTRRLAEQAQLKTQGPIPEKLTFKEKMKMFAMETGEGGTPKDKSKISRAQREIDNLSSPSSSLVH